MVGERWIGRGMTGGLKERRNEKGRRHLTTGPRGHMRIHLQPRSKVEALLIAADL